MYILTVIRGKSWLRQETYRKLREEMKVLTAQKIYGSLERWDLPERRLADLEREFFVDSHQYWPEDEDRARKQEIENRWRDQSERLETEMETFSKEASSSAGDLLGQVKVENKERFDYREFLRKFAVLKEEMSIDQDSFDYVLYSYGLSLYGNLSLIHIYLNRSGLPLWWTRATCASRLWILSMSFSSAIRTLMVQRSLSLFVLWISPW